MQSVNAEMANSFTLVLDVILYNWPDGDQGHTHIDVGKRGTCTIIPTKSKSKLKYFYFTRRDHTVYTGFQ